MNLKEVALHGYYYSTIPVRSFIRRKMTQDGCAPLCVLFYHRVADHHPNPWSISNREFQRQMRWLKRNVDVVSLGEIQNRMRNGRSDRVAVAVTFDDGYAENCEQAIPFLFEQGIPFTYFVSLDFVIQQRAFPHDIECGCPVPPNSEDQIRQISDLGAEIGAHTRHHPSVGEIHDPKEMFDEVVSATDELSALIGKPIRYFAFPYGQSQNMSAAAVHLARRYGFEGVCSAFGAYNFPGNDAYHIRRIHADPEFIRFKNWLTIDPRKTMLGRDFRFSDREVSVADVDRLFAEIKQAPQQESKESTTPIVNLAIPHRAGPCQTSNPGSRFLDNARRRREPDRLNPGQSFVC